MSKTQKCCYLIISDDAKFSKLVLGEVANAINCGTTTCGKTQFVSKAELDSHVQNSELEDGEKYAIALSKLFYSNTNKTNSGEKSVTLRNARTEMTSSESSDTIVLTNYPASFESFEKILDSIPKTNLFPYAIDGVFYLKLRCAASIDDGGSRRNSLDAGNEDPNTLEADVEVNPDSEEMPIEAENRFVEELKLSTERASHQWVDFSLHEVVCNLPNGSKKDPDQVARELINLLESIPSRKSAFKAWLSGLEQIHIPIYKELSTSQKSFCKQVKKLYGAMGRKCCKNSTDVEGTISTMTRAIEAADLGKAHVGGIDAAQTSFIDTKAKTCLSLTGGKCDHSLAWTKLPLPGVGLRGRQDMPLIPPVSKLDREIRRNELQQFLAVSVEQFDLVENIDILEQLVSSIDTTHPWIGSIHARNLVEKLSSVDFAQKLSNLLELDPIVASTYSKVTDALMLIVHVPTAPQRKKVFSSDPQPFTRYRPSFASWQNSSDFSYDYLFANVFDADLKRCSSNVLSMFPADQSIISVRKSPNCLPQLLIKKLPYTFGLEQQELSGHSYTSNFFMDYGDSARLATAESFTSSAKPDGFGTIRATYTSRTNVVTSCYSSGLITHQTVHSDLAQKYTNGEITEHKRLILSKGTVRREFSDGSSQTLFYDGTILNKSPKSANTIILNPYGQVIGPTTSSSKRMCKVSHTVDRDAKSGFTVISRSDGVVICTSEDKTTITRHADGTLIVMKPSSHVLVSKGGYPDVLLNIKNDGIARKHSNGVKVAVTNGGILVRSTVRFPDGTIMCTKYDTRVIASVNGIIECRKSCGSLVTCFDSGVVTCEVNQTSDTSSPDPMFKFSFNCIKSTLNFTDYEFNQFSVRLSHTDESANLLASGTVELAGEISKEDSELSGIHDFKSKAVINSPMEPYAFLCDGMGGALEFLRPEDCIRYRTIHSGPTPISTYKHEVSVQKEDVCTSFKHEVFVEQKSESSHHHTFEESDAFTLIESLSKFPAIALKNVAVSYPPPYCYESSRVIHNWMKIEPILGDELLKLKVSKSKYLDWQAKCETIENDCEVLDPRCENDIDAEKQMQKRILTAFKVARAKRKADKMRKRDGDVKATNNNLHLESLLEEDEDYTSEDESDEDVESDLLSHDSDAASQPDDLEDCDDDDYSLALGAFGSADLNDKGRLTIKQARVALVNATGSGVSMAEVTALFEEQGCELDAISFDAYSRALSVLKDTSE